MGALFLLRQNSLKQLLRASTQISFFWLLLASAFVSASSSRLLISLLLLETCFGLLDGFLSQYCFCFCPRLLQKLHPTGLCDSWVPLLRWISLVIVETRIFLLLFLQQSPYSDLYRKHWTVVTEGIKGCDNILVLARKSVETMHCQFLDINVHFHGLQHRAQMLHPSDLQKHPLSCPHFYGVKLTVGSQFIKLCVMLETLLMLTGTS